MKVVIVDDRVLFREGAEAARAILRRQPALGGCVRIPARFGGLEIWGSGAKFNPYRRGPLPWEAYGG